MVKVKKETARERQLRKQREAWDAENRRIEIQRRLFAAMDPCPAKDRLLVVMRERVIWLLDNCRTEEADAVLEFMPEPEATAILDEWFEWMTAATQ